jgi:hypothetical protein
MSLLKVDNFSAFWNIVYWSFNTFQNFINLEIGYFEGRVTVKVWRGISRVSRDQSYHSSFC